jgi:hypothetical protein
MISRKTHYVGAFRRARSYTKNVTWQLEPTSDGACGTGDQPPAITKIFFDAPQEWREVRVLFEFRDLPLPPRSLPVAVCRSDASDASTCSHGASKYLLAACFGSGR